MKFTVLVNIGIFTGTSHGILTICITLPDIYPSVITNRHAQLIYIVSLLIDILS